MTDSLQKRRLIIQIAWIWHKMIRIHNMTKYPKSSKWHRKNVPKTDDDRAITWTKKGKSADLESGKDIPKLFSTP